MGDALRGCCWPFSVYSAEGGVEENLTNASDISADEWRYQYYVARASGAQVDASTVSQCYTTPTTGHRSTRSRQGDAGDAYTPAQK